MRNYQRKGENIKMKRLFVLLFISVALLRSVPAADEEKSEGEKKSEETGTVIGIDLGTTYSW